MVPEIVFEFIADKTYVSKWELLETARDVQLQVYKRVYGVEAPEITYTDNGTIAANSEKANYPIFHHPAPVGLSDNTPDRKFYAYDGVYNFYALTFVRSKVTSFINKNAILDQKFRSDLKAVTAFKHDLQLIIDAFDDSVKKLFLSFINQIIK